MVKIDKPRNVSEFDNVLVNAGSQLVVAYFRADFSVECTQMDDVFKELADDIQFVNVLFVQVEVEEVSDLASRYLISAVPTFILLRNKSKVDRINGTKAALLTQAVTKHASFIPAMAASQPHTIQQSVTGVGGILKDLNERLKGLINSAPVMLFLKGSRTGPRCGFSMQTVQLLDDMNIAYSTFDILTDESVRQGLKAYSNWPTYPQLYVNGELIGGIDILKEMAESGDLKGIIPASEDLSNRLSKLINKSKVMLFMKGEPSNPSCRFSKATVQILNELGVKYDTFDILSDEEVRQGLKKLSNWPSYPQLYVNGELIGGLDIISEMKESGDLLSALN